MYSLAEITRNEILELSKLRNYGVTELSDKDTMETITKLINKFSPEAKDLGLGGVWIHLLPDYGHSSVMSPNAWRWIEAFNRESRCYLVASPRLLPVAYEFSSIHKLVQLLSRVSIQEYFVLDVELKYLFGFSHEKSLEALGTASEWLDSQCNKIFDLMQIAPTSLEVSNVDFDCWGNKINIIVKYGQNKETKLTFSHCTITYSSSTGECDISLPKVDYILMLDNAQTNEHLASIRTSKFNIEFQYGLIEITEI